MPRTQLILLDSCAVINLFATRQMRGIIEAAVGTAAIVDVVAGESQFVRDAESETGREYVDLRSLIADDVIRVLKSDDEAELNTFIDLTRELDDGEAMTAAVALHRGGVVVTDDRKALRILSELGVPVRSSLALCKAWSESGNPDPQTVRDTLIAIRERARYEPARTHVLRNWWESIVRL